MILAQNHPQLLNGNKNGTIIVIGLLVKRIAHISLLVFLIGLLGFKSEPVEEPVAYQSELPVYNIALFLPLHLHNKTRRGSDTSTAIYDYYEGVPAFGRRCGVRGAGLFSTQFQPSFNPVSTFFL